MDNNFSTANNVNMGDHMSVGDNVRHINAEKIF